MRPDAVVHLHGSEAKTLLETLEDAQRLVQALEGAGFSMEDFGGYRGGYSLGGRLRRSIEIVSEAAGPEAVAE